MLGKLLKYEIKSIAKFLAIFYALSLFFGTLTRIFLDVENSLVMNILGQIWRGAAISMMFSILINNLMRMWVRCKQNLYGDESYLTHTLPVKKSALYLAKALTALITLTVSMLVIVLTLFIMFYSKENLELLKGLLLPMVDLYDVNMLAIILAFLFILFLEIANTLQCGFTGIILGHRENHAKVGYSVLYGFVAYMITQGVLVAIVFAIALFNENFMNLFVTNGVIDIQTLKIVVYMTMAVYTLFLIVGYFVNKKLLEKGVNVD